MYVTPRYRHHYEELPFEETSADLVTGLLVRARLFIDVGAHYGFYTLLAAKKDNSLEVIACEPTPETCKVLAINVALNELKNVSVHQIAVSDKDGAATFNVSLSSDSCGFHANPEALPLRQVEVATRTLDSLLKDHAPCPTLIKIDTEGHELAVLRGLSATLQRFPDLQLLVEFNPLMQRAAGFADDALVSHIEAAGYNIFLANESARSVIRVKTYKQLCKLVGPTGYANLYCVRPEQIIEPSGNCAGLKHGIESPRVWKVEARDLAIRGWCFGERETIVQAVRARRGKHVWNARYGLAREGIQIEYPDVQTAARSGFEVRITVPIFPGWLKLEAQDQYGQWHRFHSRPVSCWRRLLRIGPRSADSPPLTAAEALPRILECLRFTACILAVSHSDYRIGVAGTQKLLQQEELLLAARGVSYLEIHPAPQRRRRGGLDDFLIGLYVDSHYIGVFVVSQLRLTLQELARLRVNIHAVHLHHLLDFDLAVVDDLMRGINAGKTFFIHDFYSICIQFNLLKNDNEFCGGPPVDSPVCRDCSYGGRRPAHFGAFQTFLGAWKPDFVAPSELASGIWLKSFPHLAHKVRIIPHLLPRFGTSKALQRRDGARLRMAYVGYQHANKGWAEWKRVARAVSREDYELFVLGSCTEALPNVESVPVSFVDDGPDAMLEALRRQSIDLAFLWSLVPETYSFTLFESMAAGCFILTNPRSGNIAAQVSQTGRGLVADRLEDLLAFLLDARRVGTRLEEFRKQNLPFELIPNPALADEIAAAVPVAGEPFRNSGLGGHSRQTPGPAAPSAAARTGRTIA
jgi:FkbM family methyltransferase